MEYVSSLSLSFTHVLCGGDAHSPNTRVIDPFQINPVGVSVDPSAEESLPHVQEGRLRQALGQAVGDLHLRCDPADASALTAKLDGLQAAIAELPSTLLLSLPEGGRKEGEGQ